jgi:hypothetical protein
VRASSVVVAKIVRQGMGARQAGAIGLGVGPLARSVRMKRSAFPFVRGV